jgi:ABC-type Fe3+-hydroxamate transport system substrate-binding protein
VGRTRFCIHPTNNLPIVGGTKDLDAQRLKELKPDLLIVDREENLPAMAEHMPTHITHVESIQSMPDEIEKLSHTLKNKNLQKLAEDWRQEIARPNPQQTPPGIIEWIKKPAQKPEQILYLIWRGPWMTVSPNTFPGSMLQHLGQPIAEQPAKYPEIDLADFDPEKTLLLFSSEPYPFHKKAKELHALNFPSAIVNGESYTWFGIRSLKFLKSLR